MNPVYINGIGILSRCAGNADELTQWINGEKNIDTLHSGQIDYIPIVPSSKLRRCSRYSKLAVEASAYAASDSGISGNEDMYRIGTVISSGFGAVESNIKFADSVVKNNPALCSPAVFSGTVPNSCVGQICIVGGYKGVSTMLMGGDPLEYSFLLLNTDKADTILCGSIDEYSDELADSIMSLNTAEGMEISEGAAILAVSKAKNDNTYCKVIAFGSASFSNCPYIHKISFDEGTETIISILKQLNTNVPDVILASGNGTYFDDIEKSALKEVFSVSAMIYPKKVFGETFGCGYMLNVAYASDMIKNGKAKSALVTGIDTAGNYMCCILEEV